MKLFEKMRQQKLMSMALMLFTLSVGILIGTLLNTQVNAARDQTAPDATPLTVPRLSALGNDFTALAKKLEPSVVNITVDVAPPEKGAARGQAPDDNSDEVPDFFRRFFGPEGGGGGQDVPEAPKRQASGSGFLVDRNGYIITNNHVVENATKIRVRLHGDPGDYRGRVIGTDYETDLAVIKIDAGKPLQPVTIANSDSVQVGDWAVAIGSPFGLDATVTAGIVSAIGRSADQLGSSARAFQHFIQTDAAINPGNSGGPLLNIRGEVIGVNTMIATSGRGSEGVGFALPVNMVARAYNDIIRIGRVTRGSIGVSLDRSPQPEVTLRALGVNHGAIIEAVSAGGPAEKGGLRAGDIILGVNGTDVKDGDDLVAHVADTPVGAQAMLSIDREGKPLSLKVTIADRSELYKDRPDIVGESKPKETITSKAEAPAQVKFGFRPRPLTEQERDTVVNRRGVMVTLVEQDSFAEEIGIQNGDVIDAINRQPVNSLDDIKRVQEKLKPGDAVAFHVLKNVTPPPAAAAPRSGRGSRTTVQTRPALDGPQGTYVSGILPGR
ncbi:MAG: Do family serine endopeptidase [Acidobacteriia bacterium]|nr:Do family serine endopeptidase [Terriglobia bacterium]